ncbi:acyl-CoA synthetase [Herminiimonas fonticola]|uniref:Putative LPLAT superfamily acyltransferase n=1 Tax=Herminiimonas fonticola TaxID=303380 RepID=A0A4R6GH58_9BURK|nr:acyl-CoA synthetase [Herminiimonas fonticola]RBA25052.1 putative acyltransferase [Herminiimonas fonticola]TDN94167.1 putative LPLAT superfamily acyltransferase [Herminiimonas fonticola]
MPQDWTDKKEGGHLFLLRIMVWIARVLGRHVSRMLLYPITFYFFLKDGDSRRISANYLGKVLGRKPHLHEVFSHLLTFARVLLDRVYFLLGHAEKFDIRVIDDAYVAEEASLRSGGVFMMGAHLGSFEAARLISRRKEDLKLVLLMYEENARKISALMTAINPAAQQEIVPLGNLSAMLTVRDRLAEGSIIGILADRTLRHEKNYTTSFLGAPADFALGPFKVAAMMRRPVFVMAGLYCGGNRYDIHLEKIADFGVTGNSEQAIEAAVTKYVARIEHFTRLAPYNWFNFYDFWQERGE